MNPDYPDGIYVASRASVPDRVAMWKRFQASGVKINSSWINEAGQGETLNYTHLWERITDEIACSQALVLYAEPDDFPLKGALVEVGAALGLGRPVVACLPGVQVEPRNCRPVGSWLAHPLVRHIDSIQEAVDVAVTLRPEEFLPKEMIDKILYRYDRTDLALKRMVTATFVNRTVSAEYRLVKVGKARAEMLTALDEFRNQVLNLSPEGLEVNSILSMFDDVVVPHMESLWG